MRDGIPFTFLHLWIFSSRRFTLVDFFFFRWKFECLFPGKYLDGFSISTFKQTLWGTLGIEIKWNQKLYTIFQIISLQSLATGVEVKKVSFSQSARDFLPRNRARASSKRKKFPYVFSHTEVSEQRKFAF